MRGVDALPILVALAAGGCTGSPAPRCADDVYADFGDATHGDATHAESLDPALEEWHRPPPSVRSRRLATGETAKSMGTIVIHAPQPPQDPPVGIGRRVDVRFVDADFDNVIRMLSDVGRFDVVTDGALPGKVSVDLRRVRPYEALVVLAQAHGLTLERRGNLVIVRGRQ